MTEKLTYSTLYVELDCILDTRLGTLFYMGAENVDKAIANHYYERQIDMFAGVDNVKFKELYDNRKDHPDILKLSIRTHICDLVKEFALRTHENTSSSPFHYHPKILLNTYPYLLNDEELDNLVAVIRDITSDKADIEVNRISPEDITPHYIKHNLSMLVMYDYPTWLEKHSVTGAIKSFTNPDVTMFGPALYFKPINPTEANLPKVVEALETLAAPFIGLKLLHIREFSSVVRFEKKSSETNNTRQTI